MLASQCDCCKKQCTVLNQKLSWFQEGKNSTCNSHMSKVGSLANTFKCRVHKNLENIFFQMMCKQNHFVLNVGPLCQVCTRRLSVPAAPLDLCFHLADCTDCYCRHLRRYYTQAISYHLYQVVLSSTKCGHL